MSQHRFSSPPRLLVALALLVTVVGCGEDCVGVSTFVIVNDLATEATIEVETDGMVNLLVESPLVVPAGDTVEIAKGSQLVAPPKPSKAFASATVTVEGEPPVTVDLTTLDDEAWTYDAVDTEDACGEERATLVLTATLLQDSGS